MLQLSREPHSDFERIRHVDEYFSLGHYDIKDNSFKDKK